jgi:hypothetical protein
MESKDNSKLECSICFKHLIKNNSITTICNHTFCSDCILQWISISNSCPYCRKPEPINNENNENNEDKKCWICSNIDNGVSLLPINFGSHHNNYLNKWNLTTNKKNGNRLIRNNRIIYDYTNELCAPICFNCAH